MVKSKLNGRKQHVHHASLWMAPVRAGVLKAGKGVVFLEAISTQP